MTIHPNQAKPNPLDPATLATLVQDVLDALPQHPDATAEQIANKREAARMLISACSPRDSFEAVLAARFVITHYTFLEAGRCAAQPDLPHAVKQSYQGKLVSLGRLSAAIDRDLRMRKRNLPVVVTTPVPMPAPRPKPAPAPAAAPTPASGPIASAAMTPAATAPTMVATPAVVAPAGPVAQNAARPAATVPSQAARPAAAHATAAPGALPVTSPVTPQVAPPAANRLAA